MNEREIKLTNICEKFLEGIIKNEYLYEKNKAKIIEKAGYEIVKNCYTECWNSEIEKEFKTCENCLTFYDNMKNETKELKFK